MTNNEQSAPTEKTRENGYVMTSTGPVYDPFAAAHPFTDSAQPMPKSYGGPWLR